MKKRGKTTLVILNITMMAWAIFSLSSSNEPMIIELSKALLILGFLMFLHLFFYRKQAPMRVERNRSQRLN